jgi:hypothetical protein
MRTLLLTALILNLLVSQGVWLDHRYHDYAQDEVCEICISAHVHGLSTSTTLPEILTDWQTLPVIHHLSTIGTSHFANFQLIRAPPSIS